MPKNKVSDPITDQEIPFARLVLSGTTTERQAAEAAGLNPDSAAYTKSKSRVRAYIHEHRAAVEQQLVQQEAQGLRRLNPDREQVLARLWEIANLSPDMTRGSVTGQVKAVSMIIAMENFIPNRHAVSSEEKSAPAAVPQIYKSAWLRAQQAATTEPKRGPDQQQDGPGVPACPAVPEPELAPASAGEAPPACPGVPRDPRPNSSTFANPVSSLEAPPPPPYVPMFASVSDTRVPFSTKKNLFGRRR
jgi:hypothetical protein